MRQIKTTLIPATKPDQTNSHLGTPGKIHVVGYAQVIKGIGAGLQIRKKIRKLIADRPDWELNYVTTDYCKTEFQDSTCRTFISICHGIKHKYFEVLIIYSDYNLNNALSVANFILSYCQEYGVELLIAHNDLLIVEKDFILL